MAVVRVASGWGLDWGNVPAWVGAVLTSTSLLVAALTYRRSVDDKERDQASNVAAWVARRVENGTQRKVLRVSNGSDAPVYEIIARVPEGYNSGAGVPQGGRTYWFDQVPAKSTSERELPPDVAAKSLPVVKLKLG